MTPAAAESLDVLVVGPYESINPYCAELAEALARHQDVRRLSYGPLQFWHGGGPFDVVHLQFPELLTDYRPPAPRRISEIGERLEWWRSQGSVIAVTLHDWVSHNTAGGGFDRLFDLVFGAADLVLHLGPRSAQDAADRGWCPLADHVVVPHHLFASFGSPVPQSQARRELGIDEAPSIVVVAQTIRTPAEVELIDAARHGADLIIVAGSIQAFEDETLGAVRDRLERLDASPDIELRLGRPDNAALARIVSAGDVAMIARTDPCNSGGIALGTALARVVIGPDVGNVGARLRELANPTFAPDDPSSIVDAARRAVELARADHGDAAREHATTAWSGERVADLHVAAYHQAVASRPRPSP